MSSKAFEYFSKPPFATEELNVLASGKWIFSNNEPRILTYGWLTATTSRWTWGEEKTTEFHDFQKLFVRNQLAFLTSVLNINFVETNDQADLRFGITTETKENKSAYGYQSVTTDVGGGYHRDVLMVADALDPNRLNFDPSISENGVNGLVHEIDHALGIKHVTEGHTVVSDVLLQKWYTGTNTAIYSGTRNTFGINDLEYYWATYGKSLKPYQTEDNTYTPISGRYDLIYDTAGNDSIVIKGLTTSYSPDRVDPLTKKIEVYHFAREINLNPSTYSTVYRANDLYILENTFVERVFDSSESSLIKGNQISNYIDAGLGSDTVFGGDGDDTIIGGPSSNIPPREMVLVKLNDNFIGNVYGDSYLKTTKAIALPSNSITIELVVGLNELPTDWNATLIGYSSGGEWDDRQFNVYIGNDYLRMWVAGDLYVSKIFTPTFLQGSDAKRLTFSWDSLSGAIRIYINGELIDSGIVAKGKSLTTGNFWIASSWSQIFKGNIGDIAIWSKAIAAYDEKSSLLSNYSSLLIDPDLKFLWSPDNLTTSDLKNPQFVNLKDSNTNLNLVNVSVNNTFSTSKINTSSLFFEDLDYIDGGTGNDLIYGGKGNDNINGGPNNDQITGGDGNDVINGGTGIDTAIFTGTYKNYKVSVGSASVVVSGDPSTDGTDNLTNIERLKFFDKSIAIDLSGNAGITVKVIGAVLGKSEVQSIKYVGLGLSFLDKGMSYSDLGALALSAVGATTNDAVVSTLWKNVIGTDATAEIKAPYIKMLTDGMKVGDLVVLAADTSFNTTNINLVGLAPTGIEYLPVS
jgi:Ca2+-binding RTX toxin-like protein